MPFGQPVLNTLTTQPNGTTKFSNDKTQKLKQERKKEKKRRERITKGDAGEEDEVQTKLEPDGSS